MDATSLNLATMVIGAVLGGILGPVGFETVSRLFNKKKKALGLQSAIYFLLIANGLWIMGEICLQLMFLSKDTSVLYALGLFVGVGVFLIASYTLWLAYLQLPENPRQENLNFLERRSGPLSLYIFGNLVWIGGELTQTSFDAISLWYEPGVYLGYIVRLLTAGVALILFVAAAWQMWKNIPHQESEDELLRRLVEQTQF